MGAELYAKRYLKKPPNLPDDIRELKARINAVIREWGAFLTTVEQFPEIYPDAAANEKKAANFEAEADRALFRLRALGCEDSPAPDGLFRLDGPAHPATRPKAKRKQARRLPYDLHSEVITDLKVYPMDGTFQGYELTGFVGTFKGKRRKLLLDRSLITDGITDGDGIILAKVEKSFQEMYSGQWT